MAGRRSVEDRLSDLNALRSEPVTEETVSELQRALSSKVNHVAARAAEIVGEFMLTELESDLVEAFDRFMNNAAKIDPGCAAKTAIADALYRMEAYQPDLLLQGIGHVQWESVYGGKEDTAAKLRGICALGLVRIHYPNVMILLAHLLADPEVDARISAARAIGYSGQTDGVPLLRFKALIGDDNPQVLCECFSSLIALDPEPSLAFVAGFLQSDSTVFQEAAAVALGESQLVQALPFLETAWEDAVDPELRRTFLLGIALLRQERAIDFLIDLVAEGDSPRSKEALEALAIYREDSSIWARVEGVLDGQSASRAKSESLV
jgi:HEAT repeat protein